ncbi:MAG: HAD family hydrolase [Nitrospirae bacterium]|nr:HAD family hydrolase [Nitrospirota bacterium]
MNRAVFLDRDGTVCEEVGYANHLSRIRLLRPSAGAIRRLNKAGFKIIIVTNQGGVAKAYFPESFLAQAHGYLRAELRKRGAKIDDVYYCPHHTDGEVKKYTRKCECRKPRTGMLLAASRKHGIDLRSSFMVGDKGVDVELGKNVGAKAILVRTGYGAGEVAFRKKYWKARPDYIADDLADAARWILRKGRMIVPLAVPGAKRRGPRNGSSRNRR